MIRTPGIQPGRDVVMLHQPTSICVRKPFKGHAVPLLFRGDKFGKSMFDDPAAWLVQPFGQTVYLFRDLIREVDCDDSAHTPPSALNNHGNPFSVYARLRAGANNQTDRSRHPGPCTQLIGLVGGMSEGIRHG